MGCSRPTRRRPDRNVMAVTKCHARPCQCWSEGQDHFKLKAMRYQSAWIRTSDIARALELKREIRRTSVTEDTGDTSQVDRDLWLDPELARRPPAEMGGRAEIKLGRRGADQGVELTQGAPVAAPVMGQVGGHDVRPQQQVGDAQKATVDALLPGVGVLFLGVVVRGDAELRDLGDAV